MARTALATQTPTTEPSAALTLSAANADGHSIDGGGDVILLVVNGSGGDVDITITTPNTDSDGNAIADKVVTTGNGETWAFGPFPPAVYDQPTGATDAGKVYVDFELVTSVTVAAIGTGGS